ncbi:MAG: energy transducer TonB [Alphaproteobacteria bacterium HGW-Alphaproteobacteria-17]|nr:MAG: energy transducer TonB [Alphaproteobacteria bacterium HGW-Alphaproteobacteria-17]
MTLIPLISAIMTAPEVTTAPASRSESMPRNIYGSDHGRHPVAALLAVGLPAALVVAVALSPMIVEPPPKIHSEPWETITLPKSVPPDAKKAKLPVPQPADPAFTASESPFRPLTPEAPTAGPERPYVAPSGTGTGPTLVIDPPADPPLPQLVLAELDPRYAASFQPDYPASEQRREIEGVVKVRVLIGTDGRVKAVELVSTDSPGFFAETRRRALAKWRFKPATRGGVAEESWKTMTVRFEIKSA